MNDTFCYYSDIDNSIYQVSEDTVTLRYYLDKGSFKNFRLCGKAGYSDNCLTVIEMSENNKYVLIVVLVNQKYYLLVYDKLKKVTCNYDLVDDDLLSVGNFRYKPNAVLRLYHNWNPGMRQCDDYMYFYFPSSDYCMMLDRLKASLMRNKGMPTDGSSRSHENLPGAGGGRKYGNCRISVQIMILKPEILMSLFEFKCVYNCLRVVRRWLPKTGSPIQIRSA